MESWKTRREKERNYSATPAKENKAETVHHEKKKWSQRRRPVEAELNKLQRQIRIMEEDWHAFSMRSQERIRKQRVEIEKLQQEQEKLQKNLRVVQRKTNKQLNKQQLRKLLTQKDQLTEELQRERDKQTEIKQEIKALEKNLAELKKREVSHKSLTQQSQETWDLENKLELTNVHISEQLDKNRQLREELETLIERRESFQGMKHRLEKELQKTRQEICDVISKSIAAFDIRLDAKSKMKKIREKKVEDLAEYNAEVKELERATAHERNLNEFMKTKLKKRSSRKDSQDLSLKKEMKEELSMDSELENLEDFFKNILKVTDEGDLESFVTRFIQAEEENFSLFKYVNEQDTQIEALKRQIIQTQEEIKNCEMERLQQELAQQTAIKKVKKQQKEAEDQTFKDEEHGRKISDTLDQIKTGVSSLLDRIDFDQTVVEDLLGPSNKLRNDNIKTYLSLVEHKVNQMLIVHAFISSKDPDKDYDPKVAALLQPGQRKVLHKETDGVHPSLAGEENDTADCLVTELDDRPLTLEELRLRVLNGVHFKGRGFPAGRTQLAKLNTFSN